MKRAIAVLLMVMLLCSSAVAEGIDFSNLSSEEITAIIAQARNELTIRECVLNEDTVFLDSDVCKVYRDGTKEVTMSSSGMLKIPVILISDAQEEMSFQIDSVQVNGWDCSGLIGNVSTAGKKRAEITINCSGAEISTLDELEDIKIVIIAFNMGTFKRDAESEQLVFTFNN